MEPDLYHFRDDGIIPNNAGLPVVLYHNVLTALDPEDYFAKRFEENGWGGLWRDGIFDYTHFHSNAHEALGIASGKARVQLGGERGMIVDIVAGDLLLLPAGTGHKNMGASPDFIVIGAYPAGQERYDICTGEDDDPAIRARIAAVPLPLLDPFFGAAGTLLDYWK